MTSSDDLSGVKLANDEMKVKTNGAMEVKHEMKTNDGTGSNSKSKSKNHIKRRKSRRTKETEIEALNEDLEQIGKLSLNINLSSLNFPSMSFPGLPNLPKFELGKLQDYPKELSNYISSYVSYDKDIDHNDQEYRQIVNSIKTAISTRLQMNNFLYDLQLGENINSAIDRLQPLTDMIHETIFSPVDDLIDHEEDYEDETEPVGVEKVVNPDMPLYSEIVKPEADPIRKRESSKHWKSKVFLDSDENQTASDLDHIEGLSEERIKELSDLTSLDDIVNEEVLREKIQKINQLSCVNQVQKNKLVTRLMMGNYYKYIQEKLPTSNIPSKLKHQRLTLQNSQLEITHEETEDLEDEHSKESSSKKAEFDDVSMKGLEPDHDEDEVFLNESDYLPSFNDPPTNRVLGCPHYQRNCKLECPTCFKWFPCRFCHDQEISDHKMIRNEVKHILCMKCNTPQEPDSNECVNCEEELASYFCDKCILYDNDNTKDIYHCDKCQICRLGLGIGKDYFHCDECNICLSIDLRDKHKCLSNSTHSNCPICNEYLFTSVHKVVFMKCGHSIHQSCYDELVKHSYKCPMCKKTVVNVETQFRILDQEILQQPLPLPYNLWRCIISCNDCKGKSNVNYHILGLKCKYCKSYNTNQLKLLKPEEENDDDDQTNEEEEHNFDESVIRLVKQNILTNFRFDDNFLVGSSIDDGYEETIDEGNDEQENDLEESNNESDGEEKKDGELKTIFELTKFARSDLNCTVGYISSMLQNFVNNATKKTDHSNRQRSKSNSSNLSSEDMIGGL